MPHTSEQSPHKLVQFLTAVGRHEDATRALMGAAELASEEFDAEVGAVIIGGRLRGAVGFGTGPVPARELCAAPRAPAVVELPGVGPCHTASATWDLGEGGRLLVARLDLEFTPEERNLLMGMARGLGLTLGMVDALETERSLRGSLEQRQRLLEVLLDIQRSISHRAPLPEILAAVTGGASTLLGGAAVSLVLDDALDPERPIVASTRRARDGDAPGETFEAPVHVNGSAAGALVATAPAGDAERELLTAFAAQASLALTDARTLEAMEEAFHDALTGLPNRRLFLDRLEHALRVSARRGSDLAVLFVDLDRFKAVNDSIGHAAGDELLRAVAERLVACTRGSDTAARFGGDEFAVLLEDAGSGAQLVADRIIAAMRRPFTLEGRVVSIGATIGIAHAAGETHDADELLRNADLAMYRAKQQGRGRWVAYEPAMRAALLARMELETDLQTGLARGELSVHYQPLVELDTGVPVAIEALARWTHPRRGCVGPLTFIPVAEEIGLIGEIGRLVLRDGCASLAAWRALVPWLTLNVNVSGVQLLDDGFADEVRETLAAHRLPGAALTLEITESMLIGGDPRTQRALERLKALGVSIAVDDFGTGYSSLRYLRQFSVDVLKIDKSFVDGLGASAQDGALAQTIVDLGRTMKLKTVAEGIERPDQLEWLRRIGCRLGQGHHFARAVCGEAITDYLEKAARRADGSPAAPAAP